jgi:hypothetical protein
MCCWLRLQARNYVEKKEAERKRRELFDDALAKFKKVRRRGAQASRTAGRQGMRQLFAARAQVAAGKLHHQPAVRPCCWLLRLLAAGQPAGGLGRL